MYKDFGYLIIVNTNSEHDYLSMAYALAISIKNTQKEGYHRVALVIDDKSKLENITSPWVFEEVIEKKLPDGWDGRSYMDQLTPFEYTVCLDADMIFLNDYSSWIDCFIENFELYIPSKAYTYRGEVITSDFYRRTFTANKLPNLYSFFTFWKSDSELADSFFNLNRKIISNPLEFSNLYLSEYKPKIVGTDEAFALSAKILGIEKQISCDLDFPRVVHMKGNVQNWPYPAENAYDHVGFYLNRKGQLKIGNFQQHDIVHYVEKNKMSKEHVSILEDILWKK